ncbi:MAG: AAA-like domain-containing protein [Polyangiaceae bacterium]|nr:AAA-like domain-containing protein [Polyangiaceae bacterium]
MSEWLVEGAGNGKAFEELIEALRPGSALALVGAGSSARVGYPLWGKLLDRMAAQIVESDPQSQPKIDALAAEGDMLWKAEEYRRMLGPDGFVEFIRDTFGPEEARFDPFHEDLVRLPFRHILTTNYDAVLEQAHAAAFHRPRALAVSWREASNVRELIQRIGDDEYGRRYVYLHGRFDDPDSIVLTERDYTERYAQASDTWPKLFTLLAAQRVVSIGFSLTDLDLMGVFRSVRSLMGPGEPRHFAILPYDERAGAATARQRLQGKYGIRPVFYRLSPAHEGLAALMRALFEALRPGRPSMPPEPPPSLRPPPEPLAPTAGYDPQCYVPHGDTERRVLSGLAEAGSPVVILGPSRSGKTALLRHVLDAACQDDRAAGKQSRAALIELSAFDPEAQESYEDFLHELGSRLVEQVEGDEAWMEQAWARPQTAARRLTWLLKHHVLHTVTERLIIAIESGDQLPRFKLWDSVLGLLRAWAQESKTAPWDRLRIAIAISTEPTLLKEELHRSPFFNAAMLVRLDDLGEAQVKQLQDCYRLRWSDAERAELTALVGGHPYLLRLAMYEAALRGTSVRRIVEDARRGGGIFLDFLDQRRRKLEPDLRKALCALLDGRAAELHPDIEDRLRGAGLLRGSPGSYRLRCPLYEGYFRDVCARSM